MKRCKPPCMGNAIAAVYIFCIYSCFLFITGMLTVTHTIHKPAAMMIAFIYASISAAPIKSELASINIVGKYTFTFGMLLNKYVKSTVPPTHREMPVLFDSSDENRTIRHITHTPNSHQIATERNKLFAILLSQK